MKITLIRHGKTQGNINREYIGKTDQPLCDIGVEEIEKKINQYPNADIVFSSPLIRCIKTAGLIYKNLVPIVKKDIKECDFGDFEGKSYEALKDNADYKRSIDSDFIIPFPNGEDFLEFKKRCQNEFFNIVEQAIGLGAKNISIVAHGGTIMSILSKISYPNKDFYSWQAKNACGYVFDYDVELKRAENIEEL
jgi:alpha-ribazole phosphatase